MLRNSKRSLHTARVCLQRKKASQAPPPLTIRPPIPPTAKNLAVSDDHQLWQFFHDKQFMRPFSELDNTGRPWTIPELRRKSFNDLHSLWYSCLKERNILAREQHLLNVDIEQPDSPYMKLSDSIRETMWRIRHVLSERQHAHENAQSELPEHIQEFLEEFKTTFTTAPKEEEAELQEQLVRLQYAIFGISEVITDNKVDKHFIEGLKYIANLKLERYGKELEDFEELSPILDVGEAFCIFHSDGEEGFNSEINQVRELRKNGNQVDRLKEISTIKRVLNDVIRQA